MVEGELPFVPDESVVELLASAESLIGSDTTRDATEQFHIEYPNDWVNDSNPVLTVRLVHDPIFINPDFLGVIGNVGDTLGLVSFRLGRYLPEASASQPEAGPTPGPTPTEDGATPPPVSIVVDDRTGAQNAFPYVFAWIEGHGRRTHHGGYDLGPWYPDEGAVAPLTAAEPIPGTKIYYQPGYESEAARMEQLLFPGAEIGPPPPDDGVSVAYADPQPLLRVELGEDFVARHAELIRAFNFLWDFGFMREAGSASAESFVTAEVARKYEEDRYLSMYEYAKDRESNVGFIGIPEDGLSNVDFFLHFSDGCESNTELLRVAEIDGELKVVRATLSSGASC
ncbi:MAG: hypothetical protein ACRDH9_03875 [Actinomycetota bacterium]